MKNKKLSAGYQQGGLTGETWVSESAKHQKPYLEGKRIQHPELKMKTYQVETSHGALKKIKGDAIPQKGSKTINQARLEKGQAPRNVTNLEKLQHGKKQNLGIKGPQNLAEFNEAVRNIKEVGTA